MIGKGVIFDFDGTIADSCYVWQRVDEIFFAKRGMSVPDDYLDNISTMNAYECAVFTKDMYNISESLEEIMAEWSNDVTSEYENNVLLKPFAKEYIHKLKKKGAKVGLATLSNPDCYMPVLKRFGIDAWFDAIVDGSLGIRGKHVPDMYLECAKKMRIAPDKCIVYEDIYKGICSAKSAGMEAIWVYDECNKADKKKILSIADSFVMCFGELV